MDESARPGKGLLESLTTLAATLVDVAHTRLDLFFSDIEEDREHLLALLALSLVAMFCLGVGVVLSTILLVVAFWESHRLLVLGIMATLFLTAGAVTWALALQKVRKKPRLFGASLSELAKDHQQLSSRR